MLVVVRLEVKVPGVILDKYLELIGAAVAFLLVEDEKVLREVR